MSKKIILTNKAPKPVGPYSQAVEAGGILFISGQIPINPRTGEILTGDIKVQTKQVMDNLKAITEKAGYDIDSIVKAVIYLTDLREFTKVNEVYGSYFTTNSPARSCIEVKGLPKGAGIEIEAIAVKGRD